MWKGPISAYAKYEYLDFARRHDWKRNHKSVFRVNTAEGYEALNMFLDVQQY
jgi:hypothetical protein